MATARTVELTKRLVSAVTHGGRSVLALVDSEQQPLYKQRRDGVIYHVRPKRRGKAAVKRAKRARHVRIGTAS